MQANRQRLLEDITVVYELLKTKKFMASDYLVVAAYQIASSAAAGDFEEIAQRAKLGTSSRARRRGFRCSRQSPCSVRAVQTEEASLSLKNLSIEHLRFQKFCRYSASPVRISADTNIVVALQRMMHDEHKFLSTKIYWCKLYNLNQ